MGALTMTTALACTSIASTTSDGGGGGGGGGTIHDPADTVTSDIRVSGYGPDGIDFESSKIITSADSCGSSTDLWLDTANNFNACTPGALVGLGHVAGLGAITDVPTSGFGASAAAITGHGYVVKTSENGAYSVYAVGEITSASNGGVIGMRIKWASLGGGGGGDGGTATSSLTATYDGTTLCNLGWNSGPSATGNQALNTITVFSGCSGTNVAANYTPIPQAGGTAPCKGISIQTTGQTAPLSCDAGDGGTGPSSGTLTVSGTPGSFKVTGACTCTNGGHTGNVQFQNVSMNVQ